MSTDVRAAEPMMRGQDSAHQIDFGYRSIVRRRKAFSMRWQRRSVIVCAILAALTVAVTMAALCLGAIELSIAEVIAAFRPYADPQDRLVVVEWRLPRALAAVIFGAALGASGAIFQSMTRNPLASPDIIGFTSGAYTGALIVIIALSGAYVSTAAGALGGGLVTALVVYLLSWRGGVQGFRLILVGIAISAMLSSVNTWLMITAELEVAMAAAAWGAGSLGGVYFTQLVIGSAVIVVLLVATGALSPGLRQLELGDDAAKATGTNAEFDRLALMFIGVGLIATVTAAAGPIMFVALAAPQIVRRITRSAGVPVAPAAFMGAFMLAACDLAAQHLLPVSLPVGVVTFIVGGSYLVWLIIRESKRHG